ncbi:MAG TPA: ABC transporter permease [candidate division WOR-3 bacterium]|uniref:ABC transporter permease n=1 Tax=candidate division WOR-3 bacterium TaxID=2052148 RepID=A0A7V0T4I9_UNCW3|nr:ABC transporter permease [candidate division WOR-3 bacterium]
MKVLQAPLRYLVLLGRSVLVPWDLTRTLPRISEQLYRQGVAALPVVLLSGVFVGMTTALQTSYQLMGMVPKYFIGMGVGRLVLIELAPVFTAFVIAGRSASSIAAELGAMRVSNQVDALTVMGVNPYRYLCLPRIVALVIALPLLVVTMELVAVLVALAISVTFLDISAHTFSYGLTRFFEARDFLGGLGKALLFGLMIGLSGCYAGLNVVGGSEQVGRAATQAVILSSALILGTNFLAAFLFFTR